MNGHMNLESQNPQEIHDMALQALEEYREDLEEEMKEENKKHKKKSKTKGTKVGSSIRVFLLCGYLSELTFIKFWRFWRYYSLSTSLDLFRGSPLGF